MVLIRQYAIKYLSLPEIKKILDYFNCDFNKRMSLGRFVRDLKYNPQTDDEIKNKNFQLLQSLRYTNPYILNRYIHEIKWK